MAAGVFQNLLAHSFGVSCTQGCHRRYSRRPNSGDSVNPTEETDNEVARRSKGSTDNNREMLDLIAPCRRLCGYRKHCSSTGPIRWTFKDAFAGART
jgi:hypothetical protein